MADISIDSNVHGGPLTGSVAADVVSTLTGLDAMHLTTDGDNTIHGDATITLNPVTSTVTLTPVTTTASVSSNSTLDIEPVAVDSCLRLEFGPLPETTVLSPYQQRWSWSVFGVEIFALDLRGAATTHIRPDRAAPVVLE